jgi:hypothetical protein
LISTDTETGVVISSLCHNKTNFLGQLHTITFVETVVLP